MKIDIHKEVEIESTIRTELLSSMFEVPAKTKLSVSLTGDLPDDSRMQSYNIGLIVGPSGSGKTLLLNSIFGCPSVVAFSRGSVIDDFPQNASMEEISRVCSSVGFNTIPSWLRPYSVLSNGERFRADTAIRLLDNSRSPITIDEFTSVVDRQVASFACHSIQKYVRDSKKRLVVASCHYDIIPWLQPDWILEPGNPCRFTWRSLQPRPSISCKIQRVKYETWQLFSEFHYMSADLNRAARVYGLFVQDTSTFSGLAGELSNDDISSQMDECGSDIRDGNGSRISSESLEDRTGNSRMVFHEDDRIKSEFSSSNSIGSAKTEVQQSSRRSEMGVGGGDSELRDSVCDKYTENESIQTRANATATSCIPSSRETSSERLDSMGGQLRGQRTDSYRIASLCGILYRPHPRVSDIYGFTRMVTLPDFQGLGLAFVLACKLGSAYKALGKRLHSYPNHPAWIRSYQRSKDWLQIKQSGEFSPRRGSTSSVGGFGGRRCAVFFYIGDAMNKEEAERLVNVD